MAQEPQTLPLQRTPVWTPAPVQWFTAIPSDSSSGSDPSSDPCGHQTYPWHMHIHAGKAPIHIT